MPIQTRNASRALAVVAVLVLTMSLASASDWPQYRRDAARSGSSPDALPTTLDLHWEYRSRGAPVRAWPRSKRLAFDRAHRLAVKGGTLYFGSSFDGKLRALDIGSGATRWSAVTEGPIRFAPVAWRDLVLVGSDDGFLYCFRAVDGELAWRIRGVDGVAKVIGNERLISKWPVRGGPVLAGDRLYFAAGIWPSDGIFIHAIDPATGEKLWTNDKAASLYMGQPHGGAFAASGVGAQGHLAAAGEQLFVPTGRAVPSAFDIRDGAFQYFHLQKNTRNGGSDVVVSGPSIFNAGLAYLRKTGEKLTIESKRGALLAALSSDGASASSLAVHANSKRVVACEWVQVEKNDRKGKPTKVWLLRELSRSDGKSIAAEPSSTPVALVVAKNTAVVGNADGRVEGFDLETGARRWSIAVEGVPAELAVADSCLYVSTEAGRIYRFGEKRDAEALVLERSAPTSEPSDPVYAKGASAILERAGPSRGYCFDLGCGDGSLAFELARQSEMRIYAFESDPKLAAAARERLERAGLYGNRVMVIEAAFEDAGIPSHVANLVVSGRSVRPETSEPVDQRLLERITRPYGGVSCIGPIDALETLRRGALSGAGEWTHQYGDPGNTSCSEDTLVRGDLTMHWYRDVPQEVPQRHGRGPAPLVSEGRVISEGLDSIVAVDAYNGDLLWEYEIEGVLRAYDGDELMGTSGTGSNFCIADGRVYARVENRCLVIDAATGTKLTEVELPVKGEQPGVWGAIAVQGGILYGSRAKTDHLVTYRYVDRGGDMKRQFTESSHLFAIDVESGRPLWVYSARNAIRHNAIAIGGGHVFLIDRETSVFDRKKGAKPDSPSDHAPGILLALDARTGNVIWRTDESIEVYGTMLIYDDEHDALVMSYQATRFRLESELGGRMSVMRASTGELLWERKGLKYRTRPILIDRTIFAEGGAWDLLTGEDRPFPLERSYGCGQLSSAQGMILYRSATLGYFDLEKSREGKGPRNVDYGGLRPGCWINAIPAGGLVLMPDASAGCSCSYLNQAWVALRPFGNAK